jgi:hypothetical protein
MNIDAGSDSFHFVYKQMTGDGEIMARVSMIQLTHPMAKAGLMMRESMSDYSRNVMIALTAQGDGVFQARYAEGRITQSIPQPDLRAPYWIKLRRRGEEFFGFKSKNGRQWTLFEKTQLSMGEEIFAGLAVASARVRTLNWTVFDKVQQGHRVRNDDFPPLVELVSGSVLRGWPAEGDAEEIRFEGPARLFPVPTPRVARIVYQPLTVEMDWKTRAGRPGVWVSSGDFFDGDFLRISGEKLRMSSVLYGVRTFDVHDEVLAAVFKPHAAAKPKFQLLTTDGSVLLGTALSPGEGEVKLAEEAAGVVRVPSFQIVELRRL